MAAYTPLTSPRCRRAPRCQSLCCGTQAASSCAACSTRPAEARWSPPAAGTPSCSGTASLCAPCRSARSWWWLRPRTLFASPCGHRSAPPPHAARASRAARRTTPCIHVFNACSGGREAVLVGHSDSVGCVAFAPLLGGGGALEGRLEAAERVGRRHAAHVVLPSGASCGGASCMRAWRWQLLKPRRLPPARPAGSRLHPLKRWELAHAPAKRCYAAAYVGICMHAGGRRRSAR